MRCDPHLWVLEPPMKLCSLKFSYSSLSRSPTNACGVIFVSASVSLSPMDVRGGSSRYLAQRAGCQGLHAVWEQHSSNFVDWRLKLTSPSRSNKLISNQSTLLSLQSSMSLSSCSWTCCAGRKVFAGWMVSPGMNPLQPKISQASPWQSEMWQDLFFFLEIRQGEWKESSKSAVGQKKKKKKRKIQEPYKQSSPSLGNDWWLRSRRLRFECFKV